MFSSAVAPGLYFFFSCSVRRLVTPGNVVGTKPFLSSSALADCRSGNAVMSLIRLLDAFTLSMVSIFRISLMEPATYSACWVYGKWLNSTGVGLILSFGSGVGDPEKVGRADDDVCGRGIRR